MSAKAALAAATIASAMISRQSAISARRSGRSTAFRQQASADKALAEQKSFNAAELVEQRKAFDQQGEAFAQQAGLLSEQNAIYQGQLSLMGEQYASQQEQFATANARATAQAKEQDEQLNRARQKRPNSGKLLSKAQQAIKGGVKGTMLTGTKGVDSSNLSLGKSSLLGS